LQRWILAIADDLTGALEVGAQFAARGLASCVVTNHDVAASRNRSVLVIDTETRHLPPSDAYDVVKEAAQWWRPHQPWLVYKKTDSTLRGNIAAEFRALLDVFPERSLVYSPAYPALGRTVRDGQLYVGGVPAHLTVFAKDPIDPIRTSDIRLLVEGLPVKVADGETDADVMTAGGAVAAQGGSSLAAGPAALAGALADYVPLPRDAVRPLPRVSSCLVVNGSLHPASGAQVSFARGHRCLSGGWRLFEEDPGGSALERADRLGKCVYRSLEITPAEALMVFGGDSTFGIHRALGSPPLDPYGEIIPGVPLSRGGGRYWITKAGGFGQEDAICAIRRRLR